jgi:hypothetical protein
MYVRVRATEPRSDCRTPPYCLGVGDKAQRRRDDFAVFQGLDGRVFHGAVDVNFRGAFGQIPGGGEGRVPEEARLASG